MQEKLLEGVRVLELAGEPAQMAGRMLADLGAEVVKAEPPEGDPLRRVGPFGEPRRDADASLRFAAWNAGKKSVIASEGAPELDALLAGADVVLDTPGWPSAARIDSARAPHAVWVHMTPFGLDGPRARWRASDLGTLAASGNLSPGDTPDLPPVRVAEPLAYVDAAVDAVIAALSGLWTRRPQRVDLSIQESMSIARMGAPTGVPRGGATAKQAAGRAPFREIWQCKDGFVQFGIRAGLARVPTFRFMTRKLQEQGLANDFWSLQDWVKFNQHELDDEQRIELQEPLAEFFRRHTLLELYELAGEHNLTLATVNSPREIYASSQLASREFFGKLGEIDGFPRHFVRARAADGAVVSPRAESPAPVLGSDAAPRWSPRPRPAASEPSAQGAWAGVRIVEFGAGAAGPIASRFFAEQGATVIRVESRSRPEFLRMMAVAAGSPHGLEGDPIFNAFNVGKRGIALNLKDPAGVEVAKRLVQWADGVLENFSPKAMPGFGLDYDTLVREKPDLVMISTCINGQTGPHRTYPGFGPQGSALSGYTMLTGYPGAVPHSGTITDFLAPRFAAAALCAGLHYQRRTGRGVYLDLSQVETALYTLSPWLLDFDVNGRTRERTGNRIDRAVPHGVFPCRGERRWVAIAAWSDEEWERLARILGVADPSLATLDARLGRVDEVERLVADYTRGRDREEVAELLQSHGLEAVPVADDEDLVTDIQYAARGHFQELTHPALGRVRYERNGFRLSDAPGGYDRPAPTLAQHNDEILTEILGYSADDVARLKHSGVE